MRRGEAKRSEGGRSGGRYRPPRTGRDGAELGSPQRRHSCAARDEPAVSLRGPAGAMAPRGSLHPARPCRLLSRGGRCPHGFPARIPPGLQAVGVRRAGRPSPTTGLPGGGGGSGSCPCPAAVRSAEGGRLGSGSLPSPSLPRGSRRGHGAALFLAVPAAFSSLSLLYHSCPSPRPRFFFPLSFRQLRPQTSRVRSSDNGSSSSPFSRL